MTLGRSWFGWGEGGLLDGSGSVEVQHQRVRFAVLSEVPDSRDRLSEVGFFFSFFPVSSTGELSSHRRLPLIADMWWEEKKKSTAVSLKGFGLCYCSINK